MDATNGDQPDASAAALNPYARRRVLENRQPSAPNDRNDVRPEISSPTKPTRLHYNTQTRDDTPMDFDDDDMLFDDADEDAPAQPEWDEEQLFQEATVSETSTNIVVDRSSPVLDSLMPLPEPTLPDDSDDENVPIPTRKQAYDDLYSFDRYQENGRWRSEKVTSPMRAKKWKSADPHAAMDVVTPWDQEGDDGFRPILTRSVPPAASDAVLLQCAQRRVVERTACRMPRDPTPGTKCRAMTLGDGVRVHIPLRSSVVVTHSNPRSSHVVGVSMDVLLQRVEQTRRKREYEKLNVVAPKSTSTKRADERNSSQTGKAHASTEHSQLWVDKHAPTSFAHLLSDERCNREVLRAVRAWDPYVFGRAAPKRPEFQRHSFGTGDTEASVPGHTTKLTEAVKSKDKRPDETNRVILLSGPPGVGKTTLAHIVARHAGYRPVEVNGSDERTESALTDRVVRAMESATLSYGQDAGSRGKPNCLILDEIDGADAARAIAALVNIIRAEIPVKGTKTKVPHLRRPIIFICNNKFAPALKALLPYARQFTVNPPSTIRLVERLRSVLSAEHMSCHGGSWLLNQLVTSTCGDIRSCLFTLQFISSRAKAMAQLEDDGAVVDVSKALRHSFTGDGMKDERNDVGGTLTAIFQKEKADAAKSCPRSTDKVLAAVNSFGDNSRILDCLFMNVLTVFYTDPTLDRCSAAHEWLSSSDLYRSHTDGSIGYAMEALHIPAAAAAIHLLCRVEQRPELTLSTREFADAQFRGESNKALLQKCVEGVSLRAKSARASKQVTMDTIPFALWALSAGEGSSALSRPATSIELLGKGEQLAFEHHTAVLRALGLSYIPDQDDMHNKEHHLRALSFRLEPPIERLVQYDELPKTRLEIPSALKQMLSQKATHDRMQDQLGSAMKPAKATNETSALKNEQVVATKRVDAVSATLPEPITRKTTAKRKATTNFLLAGAKQAKAARSARNAARVGCVAQTAKTNRLSNTGSGVPLSQVVRLKYVKGFTQAVSTPCHLEDLTL